MFITVLDMIILGFCLSVLLIVGCCVWTHRRDKKLWEKRRRRELDIGGIE